MGTVTVVVDSNAISSGFLFGGNPARVLGSIIEGGNMLLHIAADPRRSPNGLVEEPLVFDAASDRSSC